METKKDFVYKNKPWTKEEDNKLYNFLKKELNKGGKLKHSVVAIAETLNRTPVSCAARWRKIKKSKEALNRKETDNNADKVMINHKNSFSDLQKELVELEKSFNNFSSQFYSVISLLKENPAIREERVTIDKTSFSELKSIIEKIS